MKNNKFKLFNYHNKKYFLIFQNFLYLSNVSLIFINTCFLFYKDNKNYKILKEYKQKCLNQFKNSDLLSITFSNKNYIEISNYLNSKYEVNKEILYQNQIFKPKMKIISKKKKRKNIVWIYFR